MPKIVNKISVYGDSVCTSQQGSQSRAQRIASQLGRGAGYNDYAVGGQTLASTLAGVVTATGAPMFGGLTFAQHISTVDDSDICIISLGGNDAPTYNGSALSPRSSPEAYLRGEFLPIAADALQLCQHAKAAGKRVLVVGVPYLSPSVLASSSGLLAGNLDAAKGYAARFTAANTALRCAAGFHGSPFVYTYGGTPSPVGPAPTGYTDFAAVYDGLHPTLAYSHAVSDFLAAHINAIFP